MEHPVTELVTGRDLVQSQLTLVDTGALPFGQADVEPRGFAVEARVYAEDPDQGFLPQSGRLLRVEFPSGPWLRIDCGVLPGDEITTHYDPMIAKVIAYGSSRERAWRRLARALESTVVHGPVTNLEFLRELVRRPDVVRGEYHVTSIEDTFLPERAEHLGQGEGLLAAAAALADHFGLASGGVGAVAANGTVAANGVGPARIPDPFDTLTGWRHP